MSILPAGMSVSLSRITEGENRVGGAEEILTFEEQKYWLGRKKKSWLGGERNTKFRIYFTSGDLASLL